MNKSVREVFDRAVKLREANPSEAINLLEKLTEYDPESVVIRAVLGDIYWDQKDYENACRSFKKAIELAPFSELASLGLFHCLWEQGKFDEALEETKRFMRRSDSQDYREIIEEIIRKWR